MSRFLQRLVALTRKETRQLIRELTFVQNPNSVQQLKAWCESEGFKVESLDEDHINEYLERDDLPQPVRALFQLKQRLSGAAPKKLPKMQIVPECGW